MPDKAVGYLNPYRETAMLYRQKGWRGPIPLPHKEKHPPPTGWTGHAAPYPTDDDIRDWSEDGKRHNIGIRLAGVDSDTEIIGIDVDNYQSGEKDKTGGDQLKALESRLGVLPSTWISSARVDGISGIRYFRVPRGMAFRGQVDKDIECIQKGHRFAVVWPSIHPNNSTYRWYSPEETLSGLPSEGIPDARELPVLPSAWLDHLTQGGMKAGDNEQLDMSIDKNDIYDWADATFHAVADDDYICSKYRQKLDKQKSDISAEATSHDKIVKAHYNLLRLAAEGHVGWNNAVNEIEKFYLDDVIERDKRGFDEVRGEIFRSRINALRKIKVQVDDRVAIGAVAVDTRCDVTGECGSVGGTGTPADAGAAGSSPDDPISDIPRGPIKPVDEYEMNDDGNAQHFVDQFSSLVDGPAVRYVDGYGWITWHNGDAARQPHWELDRDGDQEIRRMWQRVKDRQRIYVDALEVNWQNLVAQNAGITPVPNIVKAAKAKYEKWKEFARISGNNKQAEAALRAARSCAGVSIDVNTLDQSPYLLGVANGVVELTDDLRLRRATIQDYITLNTRTPWEEPSKFSVEKWQEYLDTFLPSPDLQRTVQVALGHTLIGGNPEKIMIVLKGDPNTGKSTMVNAIEAALGDYAQSVSHTIFQNHKLNPVLANALNKRVIVCSEFDDKDELSASTLKRMTGGTDKIQAELKGSNATIEGIPQFVPILATNSVPSISGADKALQNRLYVIPFNSVPARIQKQSANVIKNVCGPAVLGWLIEGYREYRRLGELPTTTDIEEATEEFGSELDEVAAFAHDCIKKTHSEDRVTHSEMNQRFERWWLENMGAQNKQISSRKLTTRLQALGYIKNTTSPMKNSAGKSEKYWKGFVLEDADSNVIQIGQKLPDWKDIKK